METNVYLDKSKTPFATVRLYEIFPLHKGSVVYINGKHYVVESFYVDLSANKAILQVSTIEKTINLR